MCHVFKLISYYVYLKSETHCDTVKSQITKDDLF